MTRPDIDELFARTLSDNYEDEGAWEAVHTLRSIGTREVFDKAAEWCESNDPLSRARGADVLAQLGKTADHPKNSFPEEAYSIVAGLVQRETEPCPFAAAIAALGHIDNPAAIPLIASFHSHPSAEVRFDVAFALGCFPNDALSVSILLKLTQDSDEDVRDWATFGLGVLGDSDSAGIRDALVLRLSDADEDVREEAMVGLAKRRDQRALSAVLRGLRETAMTSRVVEAAYLLLGMQSERDDWSGVDYCAALQEKFFSQM
jgi:HEAT repeat protein